MDIQEAQKIAKSYLAEQHPECGLMVDSTVEISFGWAFYYQSNNYIKSRCVYDLLVGHGPLFVVSTTGKVITTGSAYALDHYVEAVERSGNPHALPTNCIKILGTAKSPDKVAAIKYLKSISGLGLSAAKSIIDEALKTARTTTGAAAKATEVEVQSIYEMSVVIQTLNELGFKCERVWK